MRTLTLILVLIVVTVSCEKVLLKKDPVNNPEANFEYLWEQVNNKYSYFEEKDIDWSTVYAIYRPLIKDDMSEKELFSVLADMLNELQDGHVNLRSSFDRSRNWDWFLNYPANFNETIVYRNYLGDDYQITGPLDNQIIDSVLYVYYGSFASAVSESNLNELVNRAEGLKGMIIDIRDNGGGSLSTAERIASALTSTSYLYAQSRIKTGPGVDDFSVWEDMIVAPREGSIYSGVIVVLCNRSSYSASTFFAQMMKAHPNAVIIGDDTGGGGGVPAYGELPNGWRFRFSSSQTINPQGEHIEGGVEVDQKVNLDPGEESNGIDTILEAALNYFN